MTLCFTMSIEAAFEVFESLVKFFEVSEEPKLVQVC